MSVKNTVPRNAGHSRKPFSTEDDNNRRMMLKLRAESKLFARQFGEAIGLSHNSVAKREIGALRWNEDEIERAKRVFSKEGAK